MPGPIIRILLTLAGLSLCGSALRAQSVNWDPPGGSLPVGQTSQLQLVFEDCSPKGNTVPPKVPGLVMQYAGQSSNFSVINGDISRTVTVAYAVRLSSAQGVDLPSFAVETNKGAVRVPAAHYDATNATVGTSGIALDQIVESRLTPAPASVWAGQVFNLDYAIDVARGYYPEFSRDPPQWNSAPLLTEDWSQPEQFETGSGSDTRTGLVYRTRGVAETPGRIRLNPVNQLVNLSVGVSGLGFFQQRQTQQFSVPSNAPVLEVRPLPPAPAGFQGAVGDFKLTAKVVPARVHPGDPVTWTLELTGKGNWPEISGLPPRQVSKDFEVVQPKPKRVQAAGKLFEAALTEDVVLIPRQAGVYTLGAVNFVYFDPVASVYRTLSTQATTVTVESVPIPSAPPAQAALTGTESGAATGLEPGARAAAKVPEAPGALPHDPLSDDGSVSLPLPPGWTAAALAMPFGALLALWGGFAFRRARVTDPLNSRRAARLRLADTLTRLRGADSSAYPPLLLAWQRDAAVLLGVTGAAPTAVSLGVPAWATLWTEAERSLYGPDPSLPDDWLPRAQAAWAASTLPAFRPARLFLPGNLLPFLALAAICLIGRSALNAAEDGALAYRRGDFAAAEKAWRESVARDPANASARHNLSLALAQQDRWGESAAEAAAAFVQCPSDPAIRSQLALACEKAGFAPEPLEAFLLDEPGESIARLASPAQWEHIAIGGALAAALALALLLSRAYGALRGRWIPPVALTVLGLAVVLMLISWASFRAYGQAADVRAVITWRVGTLRSIPTEADVAQKTSPLPAGSAAVIDKTFLGRWSRLAFPSGQSGWVRREELISLWGADPLPASSSRNPQEGR